MSAPELTAVQRRLMTEYEAQGYARHLPDVPQSRGEVLMRRELDAGRAVLQIIHRDGHTVTRSVHRRVAT